MGCHGLQPRSGWRLPARGGRGSGEVRIQESDGEPGEIGDDREGPTLPGAVEFERLFLAVKIVFLIGA